MSATAQIAKKMMEFVSFCNWSDKSTPEITRAMFTTLMFMENAEPDSILADGWLVDIYAEAALSSVIPYINFKEFMYEYVM